MNDTEKLVVRQAAHAFDAAVAWWLLTLRDSMAYKLRRLPTRPFDHLILKLFDSDQEFITKLIQFGNELREKLERTGPPGATNLEVSGVGPDNTLTFAARLAGLFESSGMFSWPRETKMIILPTLVTVTQGNNTPEVIWSGNTD